MAPELDQLARLALVGSEPRWRHNLSLSGNGAAAQTYRSLEGNGSRRLRVPHLRMLMPGHLAPVAVDALRIRVRERPVAVHVGAAIKWLCSAQDAAGDGVSASYSLSRGWLPPYPETTGYIIPTFLDCATMSDDRNLRERALRMADWELGVQLESGGIPSGVQTNGASSEQNDFVTTAPSVFNTGQVVLGWCRAYQETGDGRYLDAARRAGRFIVDSQDDDGAWRRNLSPIPTSPLRTYKARVAWSLAALYEATNDKMFSDAAIRALDWTVTQQRPNGYFENAGFDSGQDPLTHTIAYCVEGLLEGGVLLGNEAYVVAASRALDALMRRFEIKGYLAATFDSRWRETADYECLPGNAQIARAWLRLYQITQDPRYLSSALKLNRRLKRLQLLAPIGKGITGGIKASHPIWGSRGDHYARFTYPNWGVKFFIDSLLLEESLMAPLEGREASPW